MRHPAPYSKTVLSVLQALVPLGSRILDPFAGTGLVHTLGCDTWGVELEPEWASLHPRTIVGNALALPFANSTFDAVVTSPCYGNRFADHHEAKDGSERRSYTHDMGRPLHPQNAGVLHWGAGYRDFHRLAWREAIRVLRPGGYFVLNISNHIRLGAEVPVAEFHCTTLGTLGLQWRTGTQVLTPRMRHGQNAQARVAGEWVFQFKKGNG